MISAVTGEVCASWSGAMARLVHEARAGGTRAPRASCSSARSRWARPSSGSAIGEFRVSGRDVERAVALNDVTTPDAASYIDHRLERLGVMKLLARAGAGEGDVVWIGDFSFEYQRRDSRSWSSRSGPRRSPMSGAASTTTRSPSSRDEIAAVRAGGHEVVVVSLRRGRRRRRRARTGSPADRHPRCRRSPPPGSPG